MTELKTIPLLHPDPVSLAVSLPKNYRFTYCPRCNGYFILNDRKLIDDKQEYFYNCPFCDRQTTTTFYK